MEGTSGNTAKVAIPRLKRPEQQLVPTPKPPRVRIETCARCRKRKTRCSATRPRCDTCQRQDEDCIYEQPRRDRLKEAVAKNESMAALLREARDSLDAGLAARVDELLVQLDDDTPPSTPSLTTRAMEKRPRSSDGGIETDSQPPDETQVPASVESTDDLDFLDEDLPEQQGPCKTAMDQLAQALHQRQYGSNQQLPLSEYYFYLDKEDIDPLGHVMPDHIPPIETAKRLIALYRTAVHTPFRILDETFFEQLGTYYDMTQQGTLPTVAPRWKTIMNLVFAIGAHFSHLIGTVWQADDGDHLVYMSRAVHFLELEKFKMLTSTPDSGIIQATGLLSFYYLAIGHVRRAWHMIGFSLRHAQAADFHLRNEDTSMLFSSKRAMSQTWWALHSIECILTSITGRPRVVNHKDCTVPFLTLLSEGNSRRKKTTAAAFGFTPEPLTAAPFATSSQAHTYLESRESAAVLDRFQGLWMELDIIQHKALSHLYSAGTSMYSWQEMQRKIASLKAKLDDWARRALPHDFLDSSTAMDPNLPREHVLLYLYHQSVKICVTIPSLCRMDKRLDGQSDASARLNERTADACVQAALDLAGHLPEPTAPQWLYEKGCWWFIVHMLTQAITVLVLELAQGTSQLSEDPSTISTALERLTRWLMVMKTVDGVAGGAYNTVCKMLRRHDEFARQLVPGPWLEEIMQSTRLDATTVINTGPQVPLVPGTQHFPDPDLFTAMPLGNEHSTPMNTIPFDPNNLVGYSYGAYQSGQPQDPLLFNNQFATLFDEEVGYVYREDDTTMEDWDASPKND